MYERYGCCDTKAATEMINQKSQKTCTANARDKDYKSKSERMRCALYADYILDILNNLVHEHCPKI